LAASQRPGKLENGPDLLKDRNCDRKTKRMEMRSIPLRKFEKAGPWNGLWERNPDFSAGIPFRKPKYRFIDLTAVSGDLGLC